MQNKKQKQKVIRFIKRGAKLNTRDAKGNTIVHAAVKTGNVQLLQALLKAVEFVLFCFLIFFCLHFMGSYTTINKMPNIENKINKKKK